MNRFAPSTTYLRHSLRKTNFDDVDRFRALLLLERLTLQPLRNWFEEALYVGLRDQFPLEASYLLFEITSSRFTPDQQIEAASRRSRLRLLRLRDRRLPENRERFWRERAIWIAAGGQP